jgi:hypothetical protein
MSRKTPDRRSIPYILLTLIASIWTIPELAAEGKADELSTARRAAQAAFDTHVESGMIGLRAAVEACFERAARLRKLSAAQYCYTLDSSAAGIDASFTNTVGFPPDEHFSEQARGLRLRTLMRKMSIPLGRQKTLEASWEKHLGIAVVEISERLEKESQAADAREREAELTREEEAGPPASGVKPLALGQPYQKRFDAIFDAMARNELPTVSGYAVSFLTLADAKAYAGSAAAGLKLISETAAAQLEKTWTWGVTNLDQPLKNGAHETLMYVANVTGAPIGALVLDVANSPCASAGTATRAFFVVRRSDGRSLRPGEHMALEATLHQPAGMFRNSPPEEWCTTIVGVARSVDVPEASELSDMDMTFTRRTLKLPGNTGLMNVVFAAGAITKGTSDRLEHFIREAGASRPLRVVFNSTGGQSAEAMKMGALIRNGGWSTDVGRMAPVSSKKRYLPGGCYSACTLAYAGGFFRYLERGSEFGVHRFTMDAGPDPNEAIERAQAMGSNLVRYTKLMGIDPEFVARMSETSSSDISILTDAELRDTNILTGSWHGQEWGIEPDGKRLVLRGKTSDEIARYGVDIMCRRNESGLTLTARTIFVTDGHVESLGIQEFDMTLIVDKAVHEIQSDEYVIQQDSELNVINTVWQMSKASADLLQGAKGRFGLMLKDTKGVRTAWFAISMKDKGTLLRSYLDDCTAK